MIKLFIVIIMPLLAGCQFTIDKPPLNEDVGWIKHGVLIDKVRIDMMSCKFDNPFFNNKMSRNEYIKSALCMNKKGYLEKNGRKVCDIQFYKKYQACRGSLLD